MNTRYKKGLVLFIFSVIVVILLAGLVYAGIIDEYTAQILSSAGINVIVALSLNLISGFTGQLALGHAGFMAVGAYTTAVCIMQFNLPMFPSILIGGLVTAGFGLVIGFPTLRLRGDYLAIVTLGFGEIIRVLMVNLEGITGGAAGLKGIPPFTENILLEPALALIWVFSFMIGSIFLVSHLINSSPGRAIVSIREDEIASNAMGVNVFYYKMVSFTLSAFIAGVGGGLYAPFFKYLNPTMFNFLKSVDFLIIVVLGGMGSITGTVVAGFALTYLQEFLRVLKDYRLVIYPLLLILIMLFRPGGLMGNREISPFNLLARLQRMMTGKKELKKAGEDQ